MVTDVPYLMVTAGSCFILWGLLFPCKFEFIGHLFERSVQFNHLITFPLVFYLQLFAIVHGVNEIIALNLVSSLSRVVLVLADGITNLIILRYRHP